LAALDRYAIRYLVVGGVAVTFYSVLRYTKVLDLLVCVHTPEHERLYKCLAEFGAPIHLVTPEYFLRPDFVFHFGAPPWRVDILTSIPGVEFEEAYRDRQEMPIGDFTAACIPRQWLIRAKISSGRPQDMLDVASLTGPQTDRTIES
jgi:hypothetical protein